MKRNLLTWVSAAALGIGMAMSSLPASAAGQLSIYNWFDYLPQELIDKFSAEHDVEVTLDTYDSNETLLARLTAGVTGYDVAVPGDYMVQILIEQDMLERTEPNTFENFSHMNPAMIDVYFDSGRHYSVPYQWGTTSFMVDTAAYDGDINTLSILFDPPEELRGRINMLKDVNDVLNAGLRYLGHPRCNDNPEQLSALNDLMTSAKEHWLSFNSDGAKEVLVSGDASVGMIWNGFGMRARAERETLMYAYPREGFTGWMDNIVVLKGAPNIDNAMLFQNFMMDPENAAALTNFARYTAGVMGTEPFLDAELQTAHELNLPDDAPAPEFVPPCAENVVRLYDRIWTNLLK
jgi:spermidine/putrescine transport system substrate-binding protein